MNIGIDETHDPARTSWVPSAQSHPDFPIQNLPFGVFRSGDGEPRIGVAIGDAILDLKAAASAGLLDGAYHEVLTAQVLNGLFSLPASDRSALRRRISALLSDAQYKSSVEPLLVEAASCEMLVPASIGDYTDFYVGIHHARNVGSLFRPGDNPLLPNYQFVPIGYHGRASSIRTSGVPVRRPKGQRKAPDAKVPTFGPCVRLDYEVELAVWVGPGNDLGHPIPISDVQQHVAGMSLLNDWSARDVQAWEYQPLGPFLAKNFHSTISPWVVTMEALAPFRIPQPPRPEDAPQPLPHLWDEADQKQGAFSIVIEASITSEKMRSAGLPPMKLSQSAASNMYWTVGQMVAHHTSNGCNLAPGDMLGTGTISAPTRDGFGSLMELTVGGSRPIELPTGENRTYLEDGDEVLFGAKAHADGFVDIGFGECRAVVLPAN